MCISKTTIQISEKVSCESLYSSIGKSNELVARCSKTSGLEAETVDNLHCSQSEIRLQSSHIRERRHNYYQENTAYSASQPLILVKQLSNIKCVVFSSQNVLASASWDCTICLWNPVSGVCLATLEGMFSFTSNLIFKCYIAGKIIMGVLQNFRPKLEACGLVNLLNKLKSF